MTLANNGTGMDHFLTPTEYLDAGHPLVRTTAATLIRDAVSDTERVRRIYYYVRDVPYDVLASFRYLAQGHHRASDVIGHGVAFCMGKASSFVALCRAAGVPARIAFQTIDAPDKEFLSPQVRALWGGRTGRPFPWHSLGEAYLGRRWVKLDATIDAPTAARLGKPYRQEFDGATPIPDGGRNHPAGKRQLRRLSQRGRAMVRTNRSVGPEGVAVHRSTRLGSP